MQNPSDPDATYDGHKGPGYQTQLAERKFFESGTRLAAVLKEPTVA